MKLIATAETFSVNDQWTEYEIYRHGNRYRLQTQECGLGGCYEEPYREWRSGRDIAHLLYMLSLDAGVVDILDEAACETIDEARAAIARAEKVG